MIVYKLKFAGVGEFIILFPPVLHGLIEIVKSSQRKELSVNIDRLLPRRYQEYLLKIINSNSEAVFQYSHPNGTLEIIKMHV